MMPARSSNSPPSPILLHSIQRYQASPQRRYSSNHYCKLQNRLVLCQRAQASISYSRTSFPITVCQVSPTAIWYWSHWHPRWASGRQCRSQILSSSWLNNSRKKSTDSCRSSTGKPSNFKFRVNWPLKLSQKPKRSSQKVQILQSVIEIRNSKNFY